MDDEPRQDLSLNEHQLRAVGLQSLCVNCGRRMGQHKFATLVCPNILWKPGNGREQWREGWFFRAAR